MWAAGQRLIEYQRNGQTPVVIYLGDHDPSGLDMDKDIQRRLEMFTGGRVEFQRLALNLHQIQQFNPPPNPVKVTDSRHVGYRKRFGDACWELDALNPTTIDQLIRGAVGRLRDEKKWAAAVEEEEAMRHDLRRAADRWEQVQRFLSRGGRRTA
jgi:hypothetical protein